MNQRERVLATTAAILIVACGRPPPPPHPAFPEAMSVEDTDADTMLVAESKASSIDAAAIPLVPATALPTEPTPATVDAGAAPDAEKLAGAATLIGDYAYDSGRSGVRKAIDAVVDEMSVLARGIARRRLVDANAVPKKVAIRQEGTEVTVQIDKKAYVATLGGGSRRVRDPNGEVSRMRLAMRGDSLYQTFHTDQGDRTNVFSMRDDGGLLMSVRITSPQLPADVRYRLVFERS